jgi:hypothetical protein
MRGRFAVAEARELRAEARRYVARARQVRAGTIAGQDIVALP